MKIEWNEISMIYNINQRNKVSVATPIEKTERVETKKILTQGFTPAPVYMLPLEIPWVRRAPTRTSTSTPTRTKSRSLSLVWWMIYSEQPHAVSKPLIWIYSSTVKSNWKNYNFTCQIVRENQNVNICMWAQNINHAFLWKCMIPLCKWLIVFFISGT